MTSVSISPGALREFRLRPRPRRLILSAAMVAVAVSTWLFFAPLQLGGSATYVETSGESMLPMLEPGALVIARTADSYATGDVVAYRNEDLNGAVVLHRVIDVEDGRFVLQGDNNDFIDSYHPTGSEILGKRWIYLPEAGGFFHFMRSPGPFAVTVGLLGMYAAVPQRQSPK